MSSSSVVSLSSFNLLFFTQVLTVLTSSIKYNDYVTDKGKNVSIPCVAEGDIMWVKEDDKNSTIVQTGKFLMFTNISIDDRGVYICFASVPTRKTTELVTLVNTSTVYDTDIDMITSEQSPHDDRATYTITDKEADSSFSTTSPHSNVSTAVSVAVAAAAAPTETSTTTIAIVINTSLIESDITLSAASTLSPDDFEEYEYQAFQIVNITVRTPPGPVTQLYFKASTILGFLIWRFNKTNSGGYPIRSFTAEYRNVSYKVMPYNSSFEHKWIRMDPINIAPNVRQMEVYHLAPNITYEFRIWANNQLGSGEVVTTNVTTLPETNEEDLIRLIQPDLDNFDPRIWILAVSVVLGTFVILATGLCIVLSKECYQSSRREFEDGWDSMELIPNIILNPGFCESDGQDGPYTRTIIFGEDDESDGYESEESDHEPTMEKFKRKVSVFFMGPTIKRI